LLSKQQKESKKLIFF